MKDECRVQNAECRADGNGNVATENTEITEVEKGERRLAEIRLRLDAAPGREYYVPETNKMDYGARMLTHLEYLEIGNGHEPFRIEIVPVSFGDVPLANFMANAYADVAFLLKEIRAERAAREKAEKENATLREELTARAKLAENGHRIDEKRLAFMEKGARHTIALEREMREKAEKYSFNQALKIAELERDLARRGGE